MVERVIPSQRKFTKDSILRLPPPAADSKTLSFKRYYDTTVEGWAARVTKSGFVTSEFCYMDKSPNKKGWRVFRMGELTPINFGSKKKWARALRKQVDSGGDPAGEREAAERAKREQAEAAAREVAALGPLVSAVLDDHVARYLRKNGLRSANRIERMFDRLVKPVIGDTGIYALKRSAIVEMLDGIEDKHGPVAADRALAHLRKAFNWHALRDDQFNSPIVKGMARVSPKARARQRMLTDAELREFWTALDQMPKPSCYARYVKTLLLTGQRRTEVADMTWAEIDGDTWTIAASRYKTKLDHVVPLSDDVLKLLTTRRTGFVFSTDGGVSAFSGYGKPKAELDKKLTALRAKDGRAPMARWTLHDLRRTARSLMSRAGVPGDVAERVLGHVIPGVRGVYDRHQYLAEKRDALDKLAAMVATILNPPAGDNVAKLDERRKAKGNARKARESSSEALA